MPRARCPPPSSVAMFRPGPALRAATLVVLVAVAAAQIATDTAPTSRADPDTPRLRERFAQRSASCTACQRAVCHLDENMLPKVFDERGKVERLASGTSSDFGRFGGIVETSVSGMCGAQPIAAEPATRKACEKLLEQHEEQLVEKWYATAVSESFDSETNMNWLLCSESEGVAKVCPDELATLDVPSLVRLETRRRWDQTRARNDEARRRSENKNTPPRGNPQRKAQLFGQDGIKRDPKDTRDTAPKRMTQRPIPRPPVGSGGLEHFVSSDFAKRAIGGKGHAGDADATDVLVYFAFPRRNPFKHAAALDTFQVVSNKVAKTTRVNKKREKAKGGAAKSNSNSRGPPRGSKPTVVFAVLDAERNEVPHPWGASVDGPSVVLYPAGNKEKPRLLPFRDNGNGRDSGSDNPTDAPAPADVLALLQKRAGRFETRDAAGVCFVQMDQRLLQGGNRDKFQLENDEL